MSLNTPGSICNIGLLERIRVIFHLISRSTAVWFTFKLDMLFACRSSMQKSLKLIMNSGRAIVWILLVPAFSSWSLVRLLNWTFKDSRPMSTRTNLCNLCNEFKLSGAVYEMGFPVRIRVVTFFTLWKASSAIYWIWHLKGQNVQKIVFIWTFIKSKRTH